MAQQERFGEGESLLGTMFRSWGSSSESEFILEQRWNDTPAQPRADNLINREFRQEALSRVCLRSLLETP